MINIQPVLKVGVLHQGRFVADDAYDFVIVNIDDPEMVDSVNSFLNSHPKKEDNYAELRLRVTGIPHGGFLLASFKRIKIKGKEYKWVLTL